MRVAYEAFRRGAPRRGEPPILRAYLKRWKAEVGVFFGGVGADSSEEELRRISPDHPIFRIEPTPPALSAAKRGALEALSEQYQPRTK